MIEKQRRQMKYMGKRENLIIYIADHEKYYI